MIQYDKTFQLRQVPGILFAVKHRQTRDILNRPWELGFLFAVILAVVLKLECRVGAYS
jgi:hypothetical protein